MLSWHLGKPGDLESHLRASSLLRSRRQGTLDKPLLWSEPGLILAHPGEVALLSCRPMSLCKQTNHILLWEPGVPDLIDPTEPAPVSPGYSLCSQAQLPVACVMYPVPLPRLWASVLNMQLSVSAFLCWVSWAWPSLWPCRNVSHASAGKGR